MTKSGQAPPVALITGASRGLGEMLARFLSEQDYHLVLTARGSSALYAVAESLGRRGTDVCAIPGDVADSQHRTKLIEAARQFGRLDLLFNNASVLGPSPQPSLADYPLEVLEIVLEVNVLAPIALIQAALPLLRQSHGLVVNISSDAAVAGYAGWGGYGLSKAALDLASRTLANELDNEGVAIVSVDPGDMRTQMHQQAFPGEDISDRPLPDVTLPFWAWLLGQERGIEGDQISGNRYRAQADVWALA